jgi:hypothetical protein
VSNSHEYSTRVEALMAKDIFGIPLILIVLVFAALGVATLVATTSQF